ARPCPGYGSPRACARPPTVGFEGVHARHGCPGEAAPDYRPPWRVCTDKASTWRSKGDMTVREMYGWSRPLSWLVVLGLVLMLGAGDAAAAEPKKFTLITVVLDGTKIWLPSSLMVQQGDDVELTLINKLDEPHGFKIADVGIEEVVQPKAQTTVKFTAAKAGVHGFVCHIHPPHIGGQVLVLNK